MFSINPASAGLGTAIPDMGDVELARIIAANGFAALSNHVTGGATITAHAIAPITPITSPLITRKSSGIFLVWCQVTVGIAGGSLADADAVAFNPTRVTPGAVALNPVITTAASTSTGGGAGYTVVAYCSFMILDTTTAAVGATSSYGLTVTNMNGHQGGTTAVTDGQIVVIELPG